MGSSGSSPFQKGFNKITWNFWETSHGKGAPDGVGAAIKRTAGDLVVRGADITNDNMRYQSLPKTESKVKVFLVKPQNMTAFDRMIPGDTITIPGLSGIHQVMCSNPGEVKHRVVSCFCQHPNDCLCFSPVVVKLAEAKKKGNRGMLSKVEHFGQSKLLTFADIHNELAKCRTFSQIVKIYQPVLQLYHVKLHEGSTSQFQVDVAMQLCPMYI